MQRTFKRRKFLRCLVRSHVDLDKEIDKILDHLLTYFCEHGQYFHHVQPNLESNSQQILIVFGKIPMPHQHPTRGDQMFDFAYKYFISASIAAKSLFPKWLYSKRCHNKIHL